MPTEIRFVPQQGEADCGVATLAMLAGLTYKGALRSLSKRARAKIVDGIGINHDDLEQALRKHGFIAFLAVRECYAAGDKKRQTWPPEPVGWRHVVSSQDVHGRYHFSAMDSAGRVFDPSNPAIHNLAEYHFVNEVTVIVRPTAPCAPMGGSDAAE